MQLGAKRQQLLIIAGRMHAIGQQDNEYILLGIRPHRSAGEAGVPKRAAAHEMAGGIIAVGRVPTEGAAAAGHNILPRREQRNGFGF